LIILSKLADYGVIVAAQLAAHPDGQATAAAIAAAQAAPRDVAKLCGRRCRMPGWLRQARGPPGLRLARLPALISVAESSPRIRRRYRR